MKAADTIDHLRLVRAEGVGPVTYRRLLARCHTASDALAALPELAHAGGRATPSRSRPRPTPPMRSNTRTASAPA